MSEASASSEVVPAVPASPHDAAAEPSAPATAAGERGGGRRLPVGAEVTTRGVHVRVWSPHRQRVAIVIEDEAPQVTVPLDAEGNGYFSGLVERARAGTLYRFRLDDDPALYPDPVSRFQPTGPHGPSCVVDAASFPWTDAEWRGPQPGAQIIYEMHVGTFTREGTWEAATREIDELANLGVTCIEVMPLAEFPGRFGWGYDGVDLFAPSHLYGEPDDVRRFVDHAHARGLAVVLDVVYNHLGPDGNFLTQFSPDYFRGRTDWGDAINFDGPGSEPVREFYLANARYWIDEFHLDGLRLDATQSMFDDSKDHILAAIVREVRAAGGARSTLTIAENESQDSRLVRPAAHGGHGLDAVWNDDFHHAARVALTGEIEAYYTDYRGSPQEFISAAKYGFLYQGQRYRWQRRRRGTPALDLPSTAFVTFIENHDQVANTARGQRLSQMTSPGRYRAMAALLVLGPGTPMLFQGQEFASSAPFLYFADHQGELGRKVREGRGRFLAQFPSIATPAVAAGLPDPSAVETFERSKLDLAERQSHDSVYLLHHDLIRLRRQDDVFSAVDRVDGAVLGPEAFLLRFFGEAGDDRLLLVNFGADLALTVVPEPLLAAPAGTLWRLRWSSEDVRYGGSGTPLVETSRNWRIPGPGAVVLRPVPAAEEEDPVKADRETEEEETRREAISRWERR